MEFDVTQYPEGYERIMKEELTFLPDDPEVRQLFMETMFVWLLQW